MWKSWLQENRPRTKLLTLFRNRGYSDIRKLVPGELSCEERKKVICWFRKAYEDNDKQRVIALRPYIIAIVLDMEASEEEIRALAEGLLDLYDSGETPVDMQDILASYSRPDSFLIVDWILSDAISHPQCPEDLIVRAVRSTSSQIRCAALRNPHCPVEYLVEAALRNFPSPLH